MLGNTRPELGGSEFAEVVLGTVTGHPPALDLDAERRLHELLMRAAAADLLASAHDCSDGGVAVAMAESAISGGVGFTVGLAGESLAPHVALFAESASRAVVSSRAGRGEALESLAAEVGVRPTQMAFFR